jgi:hypothetical protein
MEWSSLDNGSQISLVCKTVIFDFDHNRHVMEVLPSNQKFLLSGLLESGFESYTIFDAVLEAQFPVPLMSLTPSSCILGHREVTWDSIQSVIDVCSGFGGFSQGILPNGFHTSVAVDCNAKMVDLFSKVSNVPTITGDVGDKQVIQQIWKLSQGSRAMTGGFNCQPFSALGDGRGSSDPRASSLTKILFAAFCLGVHVLILECVAPASQDQFVKSEIEHFCHVTNSHCVQRNLKLDQVWPCKRNRSYWIITSSLIGEIQIPEFTCSHALSMVEQVIPRILPWDQDDEFALKLSDMEKCAFGGAEGDFSKYLLNAKGVAPCALHAWGNQLTACPCGCRHFGLSARRLAEKGLFGLLVYSAPDPEGNSNIRHIHPCECLALNGMDPTLDFGNEPRLILSAVGQLASPLQVMWITSALASQLESLRYGKTLYTAETQLHAYMSWLVMRCRLVWSVNDEPVGNNKLASLSTCWKRVEHLSLAELMYPQRWEDKIDGPITSAAILDFLFQEQMNLPVALPSCGDAEDQEMGEPETPWYDAPVLSSSPECVPGIEVEFCTVIFDGDLHAPVKLSPLAGSTLGELICAQEKLVGNMEVHQCVDSLGVTLPLSHCLTVGQLIFVHLTNPEIDDRANAVSSKDEPAPATHLDSDVSPTAVWSQPIDDRLRKPSIFDIGECAVDSMQDQPEWLCAEPLLGLHGEQFLQLSTPMIANPKQLWAIRHQFLKVQDRLAILSNQGTIFSDDEIRFHLFAVSQKFVEAQVYFSNDPVKQLVTIDPLIATAWLQNKAFTCAEWGREHGHIHRLSLPVATVFKVDSHWVPVTMHPLGDVLHVQVWDADDHDHLHLNSVIERIGLATGFISVCIQRDRRMFFTSELCGTLAIAYLYSTLLRGQLPTNHEETLQRFQMYREQFVHSFSTCDIARRPWIWATGDHSVGALPEPQELQLPAMIMRDQRIELIAEHGNAIADDEVRFHIQHIIQRYQEISSQRHPASIVQYLFFEPLVFTCWESIGRTISARWCERNEVVRTRGAQVLTAFLLDNHWFPFWWVPNGDCLTFHTVAHETVDAHKFRDVCACIGQQLGFPLFALHVMPSPLPCHDMCGTFAMMFHAHVVHGAILPTTLGDLSNLHANMRAVFVADLYTKLEVPAPVSWGNGTMPGESGPLPIMPCCSESSQADSAWQDSDASLTGLTSYAFDWNSVVRLAQWNTGCVQQAPLPMSCQVPCHADECMHSTSMDVAEMVFHVSSLQSITSSALAHQSVPTIQVLPSSADLVPFLLDFQTGTSDLMVHVALIKQHWVPVVGLRNAKVIRSFVPGSVVPEFQHIFSSLPQVWVQGVSDHLDQYLCGTRVIDVVGSLFCGSQLCTCVEEIECLHHQLKCEFCIGGSAFRLTGMHGFGPQGTLLKELAAELFQHGVPANLAETRANDALKAIGSEQLITAMKHKQPWRQLKTLGNQKKFKFVLPSELAQVVESKAGPGGKGKGKHSGKSLASFELDPSKLQILDGIFRFQNRVIPQIHATQIGPVSSGVILMTIAEADPYLRSARCVSTEPLAIAVLHRPDASVTTSLPHVPVTVPCRCTVDNEPVLADATLVQIGTGHVAKHQGAELVELDTLDVATLKYLVYRDEITCPWSDFCKAPIKFLVGLFPLLRRCTAEGCQCDMWHNPDGLAAKEPILDVWRRQFLRAGFKPAPMDKADIFSVCIRIPSQLLPGLLGASGAAGAYCEPRTADGTEILPDWTVVWTPKLSFQELMHLKQTNPAIVGIARVGDRKGLRVQSTQASVIHQLVRPDTVYLPQGQRSVFLVGPFPFGIDRAAISKAMKQAGWECRPLQPSTPCPGKGSMWIVQAVEEPSQSIIPTSHGEVVITRHRSETSGKPQLSAPVASAATLALCGAQPNQGMHEPDPWATKDPWGGFKPSSAVCTPDPNESMQQLEVRVQNAILSKLPAQSMEDDIPERMSMLEGQVQQLMAKQQGLEGHFQEFSAQQGQQLSAMQVQINSQGQQLHGHMENQNQVIQSMFAQQMEQIRGLLSKRPREELE